MDESLRSVGLKEAVVDLKEVAEGLKETSVKMQNATQALLEGQKRLESGVKQTREKPKACKQFQRHTKTFLMCKRKRSRKLNRNQGFGQQVYLFIVMHLFMQ